MDTEEHGIARIVSQIIFILLLFYSSTILPCIPVRWSSGEFVAAVFLHASSEIAGFPLTILGFISNRILVPKAPNLYALEGSFRDAVRFKSPDGIPANR